jgi:hypothetical protein
LARAPQEMIAGARQSVRHEPVEVASFTAYNHGNCPGHAHELTSDCQFGFFHGFLLKSAGRVIIDPH